LRARLDRLDAVLFTTPTPITSWLDDVRPFNYHQTAPIPVFGCPDTIAAVRRIFEYIFADRKNESHVPRLELHPLDGAPFDLFGLEFVPIPLRHGRAWTYGTVWRRGLSHRPQRHPGRIHESCADWTCCFWTRSAIARIPRIPRWTARSSTWRDWLRAGIFTHICHDLPHAETESRLPDGVRLAYDGLEIAVGGAR